MRGKDAKAALVRWDVPFYVAGADVGLHPGKLSAYLNSEAPLPQKLADRLQAVIDEARARQEAVGATH